MFRAKKLQDSHSQHSSVTPPPIPSHALGWLWQQLRDVPHPHILDCGPVNQATMEVLLRRGAKVYVADLVTGARLSASGLGGHDKTFEELLEAFPSIHPGSLSAIACWHLLDLLPRDALPGLIARLWSYLSPGGVLFCLLREPSLTHGAETRWWLDSLMVLGSSIETKAPFPYPVITNREIERLVPGGGVKTFLTRSARRETLIMK
jgi:hypothetical protein